MQKLQTLLAASAFLLAACSGTHRSDNKKEISSNNVHIDYTDSGTGDTVLLFVHGWCLNKTYWDQQVTHFSNRFRVIAIDLPGYGKSGKNRNRWNTAAFGEDIKNVIDQLELKNVILIGHSMAGDIVLQGAIERSRQGDCDCRRRQFQAGRCTGKS